MKNLRPKKDPTKRSPGRPKGVPKDPKSGRKSGVVNKATKERLNIPKDTRDLKEFYDSLSDNARLESLKYIFWQHAVTKNTPHSVTAVININNFQHANEYQEIIGKAETFVDLNKIATEITERVLKKDLHPQVAKLLLDILNARRQLLENAMDPFLKDLVEHYKQQKKGS